MFDDGSGVTCRLDHADSITWPILLHQGSRDSYLPPDHIAAVEAAIAGHPTATLHRHNAGHAFANPDAASIYDAQAADLSWRRTLTFLAEHLFLHERSRLRRGPPCQACLLGGDRRAAGSRADRYAEFGYRFAADGLLTALRPRCRARPCRDRAARQVNGNADRAFHRAWAADDTIFSLEPGDGPGVSRSVVCMPTEEGTPGGT